MSVLIDCEMERLANLLAQGDLDNADEIAALLSIEIREAPSSAPIDDDLQSQLEILSRIAF